VAHCANVGFDVHGCLHFTGQSNLGIAEQHVFGTGGAGQIAAQGDVIGVYMRIDHIKDAHSGFISRLQIGCIIPKRINDRSSSAAAAIAEVGRVLQSYFYERDSLEPISREELLKRSRAGAVTILDVRPEDEFVLGHLPNAINITAVDRTACFRLRPSPHCASTALRHGDS
jgi:rhodanese-like protein